MSITSDYMKTPNAKREKSAYKSKAKNKALDRMKEVRNRISKTKAY